MPRRRRKQTVTCPKFEPVPSMPRRCRFYLSNGACALPSEFMCVEWIKFNGENEFRRARHEEAQRVARERNVENPPPRASR